MGQVQTRELDYLDEVVVAFPDAKGIAEQARAAGYHVLREPGPTKATG